MPTAEYPPSPELLDLLIPLSPFRSLHWRSEYLQYCERDPSRRSPAVELDPVIARLRSVFAVGRIGTASGPSATAISNAQKLAVRPSWQRAVLDAWLLAGATDELIAVHTGISADVVRWYGDLFFDCRSARHATAFLLSRLDECPTTSPADVRWLVRRLGMFGGPAALSALVPSLTDFHHQAVTPLQLRTAGLPYGEELQALLLVSGSTWAPPLVWLEISNELQDFPLDERDHRAAEVIFRQLRAALHALDSAEEIADQQTATESDSILAALENRAKQPVVVSTLLEAIEPSAQEALPTRLDAAIVPCSTAS
jgi:hypothetical protein